MSRRPVTLFQWSVVLMVLLVLVFDGMDAQSLGLVVPIIIDEWGIDRAEFGWALSASLFGMSIGALAGGWLGDRIGRLNSLFLSALIFGLATIASSQVDNVAAMTALRVIGGLGFGAAGPNGLALASEWTPERFRTYVIAVLSVGTPGGGAIAAGIAPFLLEDFGWRGLFLAFGGLSVAIGFLALLVIRESPSYHLVKGRPERAHVVARRVLGDDLELEPERASTAEGAIGGKDAGVFDRSNARLTIGVGIAFSASTAVVYSISSWGTELLTSHGFSQAQAIGVIFWVGLVSVACAIASGWVVRRFGSRSVMLACSLTTFAAVIGLGALIEHMGDAPSTGSLVAVYALACAVGGIASLGISTIYSMMTLGYPVSCRSTGIGLGMMMGRVGAIVMSFSGGYIINFGGDSVVPFFGVLAVCALLVSSCAWIIDRHVAPARAG